MSQFFADLDGTTKATFSIGGRSRIRNESDRMFFDNKDGQPSPTRSGSLWAIASDADSNTLWGGARILSGGNAPLEGADFGVKLLASHSIAQDYILRFPATPPTAGQVQLVTCQGENLNFVPLTTLAAGAVKVEKKIIQFASGDAAWVTLPPQAEIWRLRMVVKTAYAGFTAPPRLTVGITGNLGQFLDVNFANINNTAGTIIDLAPRVMEASGAALVVGFTGNGATAGQLALYCEYMIPNV